MRLHCIKLVGFKSFVDATTVNFPSNMCAVVGPNGCGKSNIIDAVRWVMGESSAKHLRGESMTDVIFNGSGGRKPVGQASIELVFDNSEAKLGGQYAGFNEISVKRRVSRDGQSDYFLNGAKCRRRDITDIFLGTGLGPRSYAIIEQGMISRLIEAKPDELRVYIEEAAGISKYKERRRDTENRMRRTRENLERLTDIRDELGRQLNRLKRQSQAAERYKQFKQEERQLKAQHQALQWQRLDAQYQDKKKVITDCELKVEAKVTERVSVNTRMEELTESRVAKNEALNEVQSKYYSYGAEIARLEQVIQHQKQQAQRIEDDEQQIEKNIESLKQHLQTDQEQLVVWKENLEQQTPQQEEFDERLLTSNAKLEEAEAAAQELDAQWESFNLQANEQQRKAEVEKSRIQHFEQVMQNVSQRLDRLQEEQQSLVVGSAEQEIVQLLAEVESIESSLEEFEQFSQQNKRQIDEQRESIHQLQQQLNEKRSALEKSQGRFASLEALQQVALGKKNHSINSWLEQTQLDRQSRMAEKLNVSSGYELAVETVLGDYLQAICVDDFDSVEQWLNNFDSGSVMLMDSHCANASSSNLAPQLSEFVSGFDSAKNLLSNIFVVDALPQALSLRKSLAAHESIVTKDGLWLGASWLRVNKQHDEQSGMLQRQQEMSDCEKEIETLQASIEQLETDYDNARSNLSELEARFQEQQATQAVNSRKHAQLRSQLSAQQVKVEQIQTQKTRLNDESEQLKLQFEEQETQLQEVRESLQSALEDMEMSNETRESLLEKRNQAREHLAHIRSQATNDKEAAMQLMMSVQSLRTQIDNASQNVERMQQQYDELMIRREMLVQQRMEANQPDGNYHVELEVQLEKRLETEQALQEARTVLNAVEHDMREGEKQRQQLEQDIQQLRADLEQKRLAAQEDQLRCTTLTEQLQAAGQELSDVLENMPQEANEQSWQQQIETIAQRITRLGPINLAAIDEFEVESERKMYLDAQFEDLTKALETLSGAIRKIDQETKERFKDTFESVKKGLEELFPKVFGGGTATLELVGDDLLEAGVMIKARPPGKRNSTIHLLSGGEKALTALALVFSIFHLNPAPFCMLDEVDAPLDDANVGRYANLVKEMSAQVQFIYITHNKITMEHADQLLGVTMHEPGVSRLVAVDVEEAVELAAV